MNKEQLELRLEAAINDDFARLGIPMAEQVMAAYGVLAKFHLVSNEDFIQQFELIWDAYVSKN